MERQTDRLWKVILGVLCVIIVVLIIGIVISKKYQNTDWDEKTYPATIHTKELSELNAEAAKLTVEDAKALYEDAIANAPTELVREQTRVEYGRYLINHELIEEGLNKLLTTDDEVLGAAYKMILYATLRDYLSSIDNEELSNKYNDMIREAISNSDYAAGG